MKRTALLLALILIWMPANGQVLNLDLSNLGVALEDMISREKAHVQDNANYRLSIAKEAATVENTRSLLEMYGKVQGWLKTGVEVMSAVQCYTRCAADMLEFSKSVAAMDYTDLPGMINYVRYGWAHVVYIEQQIRSMKRYLNKANDMSPGDRITGIQKCARNIDIAADNCSMVIGHANMAYYGAYGINSNVREIADILRGEWTTADWEGIKGGWKSRFSGWSW